MAEPKETFAVGQDVMYRGKRYVIAEILAEPYSFRLLATQEPGTEFIYASPDEIEPMIDEDSELKSQL